MDGMCTCNSLHNLDLHTLTTNKQTNNEMLVQPMQKNGHTPSWWFDATQNPWCWLPQMKPRKLPGYMHLRYRTVQLSLLSTAHMDVSGSGLMNSWTCVRVMYNL